MGLEVVSIQFNHDSASATNDALTIRRNKAQIVSLPEWQHGVSVSPADAPAAYAIGSVGNNTITIKARFRITPPVPPWLPVKSSQLLEIRAVNVLPLPANPLGEVAPQVVNFTNGDSGDVFLNVTGHLGKTVRVVDLAWQWQGRVKPTRHRPGCPLQMQAETGVAHLYGDREGKMLFT